MDLFSENIDIQNLEVATRLFHESRAAFLQLFNNSPVCMSMTTPERKYVRVNKIFLEKFGYAEEEIIGRSSIEVGILDENESLKVGSIIKEKGRLQNDYVKCIAKDGRIVHTVSSIELMEMNGEKHLVSFFLDISKIIEQQEIIEQNARQLEAVNHELVAFSYSVSHDLRAPLRAINGYMEILQEDFYQLLDEEGKKAFFAVQYNAQRMGLLIEDLLSFARLGRVSLSKREMDMNRLVQEVIQDLKNTIPEKTEIKIGNLFSALGDYSLIRQVFINLISNALKYSSKKEHPLIEISSARHDTIVTYTVKDNGEGFDMRYADKLFGVFQRLHRPEEFEGTGIGLATAKRIVTKHGGTIEAKAEPGRGAEFSITLPGL